MLPAVVFSLLFLLPVLLQVLLVAQNLVRSQLTPAPVQVSGKAVCEGGESLLDAFTRGKRATAFKPSHRCSIASTAMERRANREAEPFNQRAECSAGESYCECRGRAAVGDQAGCCQEGLLQGWKGCDIQVPPVRCWEGGAEAEERGVGVWVALRVEIWPRTGWPPSIPLDSQALSLPS